VRSPSNPDGDIAIEFIGLRDGEKLHEELQIGRDLSSTSHARIMRSNEFYLPLPKLSAELDAINKAMAANQATKVVESVLRLARLEQ
jgi:FlaA1/EpsC-like NDP-sugar epimerase